MKRLMILGGSRYALPVIEAAHELGVQVVTADYLPHNVAHRYSDAYCNVSITNMQATLEAARAHNIDGVISFACDPGVVTAAYVAESMGLPSVGSYEAVCTLQHKGRFRAFLAEHSFNVPKAKGYTSIDGALRETDCFCWPVIVKPVDSSGSKGVSRVDDVGLIRAAAERALGFSRAKAFVVEEFIAPLGFTSDSECFSVDGSLEFVSFSAQCFDASAMNPYVPAAYGWPSTIPAEHQEELACEIQRLIGLLGLGTSLYNVETRVGADGRAYLMECAPRGGGNRLAECLEYATGVKLVQNAVRVALGMPNVGIEQRPCNGYWAEIILHSNRSGVFESLWIDDSVAGAVFEQDVWVKPGTTVGEFGAAGDSIGTLVLRFETEEQLQQVMEESSRFVRVSLRE